MNISFFQLLQREFPSLVFTQEELLSKHTYFKLGGPAEIFTIISKREHLEKIVSFCRKSQIPVTILGGASNVLVSDKGIKGLVIKNNTNAITIAPDDSGKSKLEVDSGVLTNVLVRYAIDHELEGLELFLGVPGSVGGAVYNNSHYSKELIGEHVHKVHVVDQQGKRKTYTQEDMLFSYDYSILHETQETILYVEFLLDKGVKTELETRALDATRKRATTQPLGVPSSGCMFQNAVLPNGEKISAGYLIDQAGLKGERIGDAMVSEKHANFIVNVGNATQNDVEKLAKKVEQIILEKFGVVLKREVFVLGNS